MRWWIEWKWKNAREKFWLWLAFRLPKQLVWHAAIRLMAVASSGKWGATVVPELGGMDAIGRWEEKYLRKQGR